MARHFFLWQDINASDKKFFPVTGNFFQWQEIFSRDRKFCPVKEKIILQQENSSWDRKFPPVTGNFFLCEEISSCHRKFLPETGNFLLWYGVSYPKFLSKAGYFCNISFLWYKVMTKVHDFWIYLKIVTKVPDFCSKLCLIVQGILPRFLATWPLKSHPVWRYDVRSYSIDCWLPKS